MKVISNWNFTYVSFLLFVLFFNITLACGQVVKETNAKIDDVRFEFIDSAVVINYDLVHAKDWERFDIQIQVLYAQNDMPVRAKTFTGDMFTVPPGRDKEIIWDITKDLTYLNEEIYIKLNARHINPKVIPYTSKKEALLFSTAIPGWGTTKTTLRKAHLIKGLVGYSLLGMAIKFNVDGNRLYTRYQEATLTEKRDQLFDDAVEKNNLSNYLFLGAASVWAIDYLWLWIAPNRTSSVQEKGKLSLGYNIDWNVMAPALTFNYRF